MTLPDQSLGVAYAPDALANGEDNVTRKVVPNQSM
jgi:hypothetical protein